jgi:hypothetical protein
VQFAGPQLPTGVSRSHVGRSRSYGAWRTRLADALSIRGYATVDLRPLARTPFVPLSGALERAAATFNAAKTPRWNEIGRHLLSLKVFGVETLALRSRDEKLLLVPLRTSPDGVLEVAEAVSYAGVIDQWLDALGELVPDVSASAQEKAAIDKAKDWVGKNTGSNAVGWMAAKLLSVLVEATKKGCCITVHPIGGPPSDQMSEGWSAADMTTEKWLGEGFHSSNYLWSISNNGIWVGGNSLVESPLDWNFEPLPWDLRSLLENVHTS